ncbi:MAG: IclR family transcriptional regulator [Caldimonas sp.]
MMSKGRDDAMETPASLRALEILAIVTGSSGMASLAQIAAATGLSKPTVHRICAFLTSAGFLSRDFEPGMFTIGPVFRKLAFDALTSRYEQGLRHAVLAGMADEVGETCNLTTLDGTEIVYLDRVEARWPLRLTLDIGNHIPIHCCASGKLFLALMKPHARASLLDRLAFEKITLKTIVDRRRFETELETIRKSGYALDDEEFIDGMVAIALPVRDDTDEICATISVHAPTVRMSIESLRRKVPRLKQWAKKVEKAIGR